MVYNNRQYNVSMIQFDTKKSTRIHNLFAKDVPI